MIYQQILDMEDEFNQKIVDIVTSMSDIAVYVVDVKQFATVAKLKLVIEEANVLIGRAVDFFNKHKERGSYSEYSPIDLIRCSSYLETRFREGTLCVSGRCARRARCAPNRLYQV